MINSITLASRGILIGYTAATMCLVATDDRSAWLMTVETVNSLGGIRLSV